VEEVGRHHGLSRIPSTLPAGGGVEGLRPAQVLERGVREVLVGAGLVEVVNYAFVGDAAAGASRVRLENPLAEDQGALRDALVLPGLLSTMRSNLRRGTRDVRLFELGRVFLPASSGAPVEQRRLGLLLTGAAAAHWSGKRRPADFYDAKGVLEVLRRRVGRLDFEPAQAPPPHVHPGKSARVLWNGQEVGYVGALHPVAAEEWEAREEALVAELNLEPVLAAPRPAPRFEPLSKFPAVTRDVSIVCDESLSAAELERTVRQSAGPLLRSASVADRYQGPQVPAGKVGLTLSLVYHDPSRTLTGEEVQSSVDTVVAGLRARGVEIRGE